MRLFLAFTPPKQIANQLLDLQQQFDRLCPKTKWTADESLHLTLLFLGAIKENLVPQLSDPLQKIAQNNSHVSFQLTNPLVIPSPKNPRVLAVTAEETTPPALLKLRQEIINRLEEMGISPAPNKPPHLTLGRFPKLNKNERQIFRRNLNLITKEITRTRFPIWTNPSFHLIKTTLTPQGAIHTKLHTFPFSTEI